MWMNYARSLWNPRPKRNNQSDPTAATETLPEEMLEQELRRILEQEAITPLFQPIVDLKKKRIFGYETLSRGPEGSPLHLPEPMFAAAHRFNLLFELDCLCRRKAIARFQQLALEQKLFINLDPNSLLDPNHQQGATLDILQRHNLPCNRVVIELTEHARVEDFSALKKAAAHYRAMGFAIAMDDLSAGYSNLQLMAELRPEFIKLDKYFVRKLATDPVAREFMRAICKLARSVKCAVISEGIESAIDLKEVRKLKSRYAQGYFLGRPEQIPVTELPAKLGGTSVDGDDCVVDHPAISGEESTTVHALCHHITPNDPNDRSSIIIERFQQDKTLLAIPIVREGKVTGLCERSATLQRFAMRYGRDLYATKPINVIMNSKPLIIAHESFIEQMSQLETKRTHHQVGDGGPSGADRQVQHGGERDRHAPPRAGNGAGHRGRRGPGAR